jgi:hypothetical protein
MPTTKTNTEVIELERFTPFLSRHSSNTFFAVLIASMALVLID